MELQKRRDTAPELLLRRALHSKGLRFRVAYPVPGVRRRTIDIAFPRQRIAVFVDGCFWHACPEHGVAPKNNSEWWAKKLSSNRLRDEETAGLLIELGWTVIRVWEHQVPDPALDLVLTCVAGAQNRPSDPVA